MSKDQKYLLLRSSAVQPRYNYSNYSSVVHSSISGLFDGKHVGTQSRGQLPCVGTFRFDSVSQVELTHLPAELACQFSSANQPSATPAANPMNGWILCRLFLKPHSMQRDRSSVYSLCLSVVCTYTQTCPIVAWLCTAKPGPLVAGLHGTPCS